MVSTVSVSPKYQVVIPSEARKELGIRPGERLVVLIDGGVIRLVRETPLSEAKGMFPGLDSSDPRDHAEDGGRP